MAGISAHRAIEIARRASATVARRRSEARQTENTLIRKSAVVLSAGTLGALKRNGVPDEVAGFPWKLVLLGGATLVEFLTRSGAVRSFAGGVSDATAAIYMDRSIVNKTLVSGGGEF